MLRISDPVAVSAVAGTGASSAVIDYYTRRIPNPLTLGVAVTGLALAASGLSSVTPAQALLGLAHEPLELCLEFWIPVPLARRMGLPRRVGLLDGEVDLAVLLDGDHLDRDLVAFVEVVPDVSHIVPVDLGDVDQPGLTRGQLHERSEIGDPNDCSLSDSTYFCQVTSPLIMKRSS